MEVDTTVTVSRRDDHLVAFPEVAVAIGLVNTDPSRHDDFHDCSSNVLEYANGGARDPSCLTIAAGRVRRRGGALRSSLALEIDERQERRRVTRRGVVHQPRSAPFR